MRAVIVQEYGSTPVVAEVPTPQPEPRQVLIRLQAAGMQTLDYLLATGAWRPAPATFPMVLGADGAGVVERVGEGATRFAPGEPVFGQLFLPPIGSHGTYAEYVAVPQDAPLAQVPNGLDPVVAAALPTAGMAGLSLIEQLGPVNDKTVLIVGAGGGVGSFATQFAVTAGAQVIAVERASEAGRLKEYGAVETVDHTAVPVADAVRQAHRDGIDALIDVASDADGFSALAGLVRRGGTAITTQSFVFDAKKLVTDGVTGINFALQASSPLLERVADAVVAGRIVAPPITRITLEETPGHWPAKGKTVITL